MKNINDYFVLYKWPNQLIFGYGESRARRQSLEPKTVYLFRRNPGPVARVLNQKQFIFLG